MLGMKSQRSHHNRRRNGSKRGDDSGQNAPNIEDSPTMKLFAEYAQELNFKHDKYERIVKLSRDITIESKRIIFFLHSLDANSKQVEVLREAEQRLNQLASTLFQSISEELQSEDPYQYLRAYSSGLQEYIEATTFFHYLMFNKLQGWDILQNMLKYFKNDTALNTGESSDRSVEWSLSVLIPPSEYVLGVADLTGELMRNCINNVGSGNLEVCMQTCSFVKEIYNGFLRVGNTGPKEFSRKLFTLRQSLNKMENACYAIRVRGSEIPRNMLADVFRDTSGYDVYEDDEGFY